MKLRPPTSIICDACGFEVHEHSDLGRRFGRIDLGGRTFLNEGTIDVCPSCVEVILSSIESVFTGQRSEPV